MFSLSSDFLTQRDAWAATFEHIFNDVDSPRTDTPETLPAAPTPRMEDDMMEEVFGLQMDFITVAAGMIGDTTTVVNGGRGMSEYEGSLYVKRAFSKFAGRCLYPKDSVDGAFDACF
eukprot:c41425_g1_i1.p1 GENE.c41425_g1_i1~~c41425_g1_i1.p1  ORF type:complete len:130 (+),score=14.49 c41425_g1_i1:41-391(+)